MTVDLDTGEVTSVNVIDEAPQEFDNCEDENALGAPDLMAAALTIAESAGWPKWSMGW